MSITNIMLDFDGTLTDIEKDSKKFREEYPQVFCELHNLDYASTIKEFERHKAELTQNPLEGLIVYGHDVAPACSDPYLLNQAAAGRILNERHIFSSSYERSKLMTLLWELTQARIEQGMILREGTRDFFEHISQDYRVAIVTNSSTDKIEERLVPRLKTRPDFICGGAGKLLVDLNHRSTSDIDTYYQPCRFPRKVNLRRPKYFDILYALAKEGFYRKKTVVIGDVYELDLALPEYLGFQTLQILTPYTPQHEVEYQQKNHRLVKDYADILDWLKKQNKTESQLEETKGA